MKTAHPVNSLLRILCAMTMFLLIAGTQRGNATVAKSDVSGHYEGTAKNAAGEVITVALDLSEKDGTISGTIRSSHGDFTIAGGSHKGDDVTLQFDAGGAPGNITLRSKEDSLVGTWSAGDDGGPVEVKRAAQPNEPKGKS